jgi:hypothetical protein
LIERDLLGIEGMNTLDQILELIENEKPLTIAVRGDNFAYGYLDYVANSMHKTDYMEEAIELDGTSAFLLWEYGDSTDREDIIERLQILSKHVLDYGPIVHIIACDAGNYEYGWDESSFGQEIVMKDALVLSVVDMGAS